MRRAARKYIHAPLVSSSGKPGCDGKRAYSDKVVADKLADRMARTIDGHATGGRMGAYRCRHCAFWHLGHVSFTAKPRRVSRYAEVQEDDL